MPPGTEIVGTCTGFWSWPMQPCLKVWLARPIATTPPLLPIPSLTFPPFIPLQVREIVGQLREGRQSLMFSATLPRSLADFAAAGLNNPQLVRLDAERKLSPDLGLAFFTGVPWWWWWWCVSASPSLCPPKPMH